MKINWKNKSEYRKNLKINYPKWSVLVREKYVHSRFSEAIMFDFRSLKRNHIRVL